MKSLFAELLAGKPAAAALAEAQRSFLKERRQGGPSDPWIHPYFWAVYTISGSELTALERSAR
jgi:CHAT domain-containing protein